ncbi:MAG TPA: YjbE family putative metal transport protein [Kiloniellales bacterium]
MSPELTDVVALLSVIIIDLLLAGDNAIVVGMIAAGIPAPRRRRVIVVGIVVAMICRILFATIAVQLLAIVGLLLAGGFLLLWVAWKMWRETRATVPVLAIGNPLPLAVPPKAFSAAILQIVVADISMSLDNVLAVAGTARHNVWILVFGLSLSVLLMGLAAGFVARIITNRPSLSYLGIAIVAAVAASMIYEGGHQLLGEV